MYPHDRELCPVTVLRKYLAIRDNLVTNVDQLIITHGKPHKAASKDTVARWIKETVMLAGVDTSIFKPHSCRAASSSQASMSGVPLMDILHNAIYITL